MGEVISFKGWKAEKQEARIQNMYARVPTNEKPIFIEITTFLAEHPGSGRLLSEARTRGHKELSQALAYLLDNWVDPEPLH